MGMVALQLRRVSQFSYLETRRGGGAARRTALRCIASHGRGDIFFQPALAHRWHWPRECGILRGLAHSSQATMPDSGKLQQRKRILHAYDAKEKGAHICSWSYLIPSLWRAAESAIPDSLLTQLEQEKGSSCTVIPAGVRRAQAQFLWEMDCRLPLLEDSLAHAELKYVLRWPGVFRRAWARLPSDSGHSVLLSSGSPLEVSSERLIRLHRNVEKIVESERHRGGDGVTQRAMKRLWVSWKRDVEWHRQQGRGAGGLTPALCGSREVFN